MLVLVAVALLPERQAEMGPGRLVVYGSLILLGALLVSLWVLRGRTLARRLQTAEADLQKTRDRMSAIFRLSYRFADAQDEAAVIDIVLQMCVDVVQVTGASFVPFDDRNHPLAAQMKGQIDGLWMESWLENLASDQVRDQCANCRLHQANKQDPCPLITGSPNQEIEGIFCFPLRRGDREMGILNLYLGTQTEFDQESLAFLSAMMDEMGVALEAIRLRDREMATTEFLERMRKSNPDDLLITLIENLGKTIGVSYARLCIYQYELSSRDTELVVGNPPSEVIRFMESLAGIPLHVGDLAIIMDLEAFETIPTGIFAALISPLKLPDQKIVGSLVMVRSSEKEISETAVEIANAVAPQIALTVRYAQMVQSAEYQAVMDERARLAREIHDGVAQTLGYLKLLAAQLENNLARGETARINQLMEISRSTLAEAYVDARQAIDGLRITPENGFGSWIQQAADDFSSNSGMAISVEIDRFLATVPPEIQAQLIRIVQEALTNIRKHAAAHQVWIQGEVRHGDLIMEIRDNGTGFDPEDVIRPSRHGLRGMQERAELIDADFQIISSPGEGTTVRVQLPGSVMELTS